MKTKTEHIFLSVILVVILYISIGTFYQHEISHDFPTGYSASDTFQHQTRADAIKLQGNYYHEPVYISGGKTDVVGFYPPLLYHSTILANIVSGVEIYDLLPLIVFLTTILSIIIIYSFLETKNTILAISSLPFMVLVFMERNIPAYSWGNWPTLVALSVLTAFIISVFFIEKKYAWILFGLLLTGVALAHTSEVVFAAIFVAIFIIADIVEKRKINFHLLKQITYGTILFLIISFYFLIIFKKTWSYAYPLKLGFTTIFEISHVPYIIEFSSFGALLFLFIIGIFVLFISLKKYKEILIIALFAIISGTINYIGFDRAMQFRFFWPIFFSFLFGLAIFLLTQPIKNARKYSCMAISAFLLVAFIFQFPFLPKIEVKSDSGIMDPYHWEAFKWMQNNIEKEKEVYFFRNPSYSATAVLRNSQRVHYISHSLDPLIQRGIVSRAINSTKLGDCCGVWYPYRKTFFEYGYYYTEELDYFKHEVDICSIPYLVIDLQTSPPVYGQYGLAVRELLLKSKNSKEVFNNQVISIINILNLGENCIGQ